MKRYPLAITLFLLAILAGCGKEADHTADAPQDLTRETVCMLDGMILMDHPGPKGQVIFKNGEHHFFCDTKGLIETLFNPDYRVKIRRAFVQDFGNRKWGSYRDGWIDIQQAFLVIDSRQSGSMGPTLITFARRADAERFAKAFGGTVLAFNELDEKKFSAYQQRIRKQLRGSMDHAGGMKAH